MTNRKALKILQEKISPCLIAGEWKESVDAAISALQAQDVPDTNVGDTVSRRAAIDALCRRCDLVSEDDEPCTEKCNDIKILEKLPSARTENADCIYCHENSDGYVKPIEKNCHAFIRFGMDGWEISLSAKGWNGSAKIMYCPMCGRKLKNDK